MTRVTGIGGIFRKARDPDALRGWYRDHLGVDVQSWGGVTVWSVFPSTSSYFDPSAAPFMVNYRVANLPAVLDALRAEGCAVDERMEESEYGKFGWVMIRKGIAWNCGSRRRAGSPGEATASPR